MSSTNYNRFESPSDSGVYVLDSEERALIEACADNTRREAEEATAHRRFLRIARDLPAVRLQKVMEIRKQIAAGTYATEGKLKATVDRLLEVLR